MKPLLNSNDMRQYAIIGATLGAHCPKMVRGSGEKVMD